MPALPPERRQPDQRPRRLESDQGERRGSHLHGVWRYWCSYEQGVKDCPMVRMGASFDLMDAWISRKCPSTEIQ